MSARDPDADVLELIAQGDHRAAVAVLVNRHGAAVYAYCARVLANPALAEDVMQQVFIQAYSQLQRFSGLSLIRTWLFALARHRVLDAVKSHTRYSVRCTEAALDTTPDPSPSVVESLDDHRQRQLLANAIGLLPERTRNALLLRYERGLTFEQIARMHDEKPGTVQARVARALPLLRQAIQSDTTDSHFQQTDVGVVTIPQHDRQKPPPGARAARPAARRQSVRH